MYGELLNLAKNYNVSIPNNGYAWHITVGCNNINLAKNFIYLINHPKLRDFWLELAERNPADSHKNYAKFENGITFKNATNTRWAARWATKPIDHYYAAFLRKDSYNVEIRIFKTTLDIEKIHAIVDLIVICYNLFQGKVKEFKLCELCEKVKENSSLTDFLKRNRVFDYLTVNEDESDEVDKKQIYNLKPEEQKENTEECIF